MLKIGFILPSSHYLRDPFRGVPFTHLYILTILEEYFGSQVELSLLDLRGIKRELAFYHIPECDVYLHSIYTLDFNEQKALVAMLRRQYPKAVHIAGGPHANEFPEESLRTFDSLVCGDGERSVIRAIEDISKKCLQPFYREDGPVDINLFPFPSRKFLPAGSTARRRIMTVKDIPGSENLVSTNALFSRGCPYNCHFCAILTARADTPGIRFRRPDLIEAEINYLKRDYGVQGLALVDEIVFPLKRLSAIAELEAIGRTDIVWRGQCRVDGVSPEIAALARQSGCLALGLGLESVWQMSLDIINKNISIQMAKETVALLKANDIKVSLYLIMGLPGESENIVDLTRDFIRETQPDLVYPSLFTIRPGTEIFRHPEKFGIKKITSDWSKTMHIHDHIDGRPKMTFEYQKETVWGKSLTNDQIIDNYLELLNWLREHKLTPVGLNESIFPFDDINPLL